jgi:sarcosine oxidase subunit beta
MARIVVAGAGAAGASVAYHLALLGADDVVLADPRGVAGGSTSRAMGGVRQQFSTAAEVRLAQASVQFFAGLGAPLFRQVGYLFLATTEPGLAALEERRELQAGLGVPVERVDPGEVAGLAVDDVLGAVTCREDGIADPGGVCREVVRRARELGVELLEGADAVELDRDVLVIACGPWSGEVGARVGVELPIRPLCRQLVDTEPVPGLPEDLPMVIEETGFHFRRTPSGGVRLAMGETTARWGFATDVDERLVEEWLGRLARRYPPAAGVAVERAWGGLYDMTPDAHPILGRVADGVYAACGFSGHGFMQSPAIGRAVAEEILHGSSALDLSHFRLDRFAGGAVFPETLVL